MSDTEIERARGIATRHQKIRRLSDDIKQQVERSDPARRRTSTREWIVIGLLFLAGVALIPSVAARQRTNANPALLYNASVLCVVTALAYICLSNLIREHRVALGRTWERRPVRSVTAVQMAAIWTLGLVFTFAFGY